MKKNFKYMIFASFLFLFSVVGVKAANDYYVCEYKAKDTSGNYMEKYGITIQYKPGTFKKTSPSGCDITVFSESDQIGNQSCPKKIYYILYSDPETRNITECYYYLNARKNAKEMDLTASKSPASGGENPGTTPGTSPGTTPGTTTETATAGCGILGDTDSKTVELLSWIIKLIRFGIPILIIVLGITDFLKIVFSGEDKVFKESFTRFVKRVLIGVIFIFVPYIIYFMVKISGVDVQYGIDNLYCGILEATSGVSGDEVETMTIDPEDITSATNCQEAGHYWIDALQVCSESLKDLSKQEECESNGYEWVYNNQEYGGYCKRPTASTLHDKESCEKIGYTWVYANEEYGGHCQK